MTEQPLIEVPDSEPEFTTGTHQVPTTRNYKKTLLIIICIKSVILLPIVCAFLYLYITNQPAELNTPKTVTIAPGTSVSEVADLLEEQGIVRSKLTLVLALRYLEDPTQLKAATYTFDQPQTTTQIANTLIAGEFDNGLRSVTFIEGTRVEDFAYVAANELPNVDQTEFLQQAADLEGQLLPETYFVPDTFTTEQLIALMQAEHDELFDTYAAELASSTLTRNEIEILASIVEREANTPESMAMVAGIFFNRLAIGMALQADASIEYVIDTPLGELPPGQLASELRELDSPYNTYLYPGLPPTPIGNPGRDAITAVLKPTPSDYFYYITGNDGKFYYAETYDQHRTNIQRHLR